MNQTTPAPEDREYRSPALAYISVALTVIAWAAIFLPGRAAGYIALVVAIAAIVVGFCARPGRSLATRRLATTAIIAAITLVVLLGAFIIVLSML